MHPGLVTIVAAVAAAAIAAPAAMAGCGGGHRHHQGGDASPDDGSDNNGGHHRGHRAHRNGHSDGWGDGHGGRRGRHAGDGGTDVDIGVSVPPTQRYGRGLIGPPTACQELAALEVDLGKLFQLRVQINSGKRMITVQNGHQRVVSTRGYRNGLNAAVSSGKGDIDQNVYGLNQLDDLANQAREQSLAAVDARISATQMRIAELEYSCQQ